MHRTHICGSVGSAIKAVHISKVGIKLPFKPINWKDIKLVTKKPNIDNRYMYLKKDMFRDLSAVGIDG